MNTSTSIQKSSKLLPWVIALSLFIEMLDSTLVITAIPRLSSYFSAAPINLHAVIMSYLMGIIVVLPFSRWILERFGALNGFSYALATFIVGSLICMFSSSLAVLILGRGVQGIGAGLMGTLSRNVLIANSPKHQLMKVTGFIAIPVLLGPAIGPILGGFIVEHFSWRYLFILNLPVGVVLMLGAFYSYPRTASQVNQPLDIKGAILLASALFIIGYILYSPSTLSKFHSITAASLVIALLTLYFKHSIHTSAPLLKVTLLKDKTFCFTMLSQQLMRLAVAGFPLIISLDLQIRHLHSPTFSGMALSFFAFGMAAARPLCAPTVNLIGVKSALSLYGLLLPILLYVCSQAITDATTIEYCTLIFFCGASISLQYGILHVLAFSEISSEKMPEAVTLATVIQQLGAGLGIMITANILLFTQNHHAENPYSQTIVILSLLSAIAFIPILMLKKDVGISLQKEHTCENKT